MSKIACVAPSWLDKEFLQKAIQNGETGTRIIVSGHDVTLATDPGDNFISELYRVLVETSDKKQRSIIVKCLPTAEYNLKFIRDARLFEKEILFYGTTLPEMYSLEKIDNNLCLAPKCLYIHRDSALVLEDLLPLGYEVADRRVGLNLEHCMWAVKALAHFHALSTGLSVEQLASKYCDTVYSGASRAHAASYVTNSVVSLAAKVEKWPGFERFASKLRDIAPSSNDRVLALFESPSPLLVLNHGDFWTNNIMFRYSENKGVAGIKIIDFQMCRYVSPALDLLYFLYTSPQEDVRLDHQEQLLENYFMEFCGCVRRLDKVPTFTLDQLRAEMDKNAFFGFISACLMLPAVLADPKKAPDLGNVAGGITEMECHSGLQFQQQFQHILLQFEDKGII